MQANVARHAQESNGEGFGRSINPTSVGGMRKLRRRNGVQHVLLNGIEAGLCYRQQHHSTGGRAVATTVQRLHQFFGRVRIIMIHHVVHAVVHAVVVHFAVVHGAVVDGLTSVA